MKKLISQQEMKSIDADFGEGPVTIYWRGLCLREMDRIRRAMDESAARAVAEALLIRARNKDGARMFEHRDGHPDRKKIETEFDPDEVIRVVAAMNAAGEGGGPGN